MFFCITLVQMKPFHLIHLGQIKKNINRFSFLSWWHSNFPPHLDLFRHCLEQSDPWHRLKLLLLIMLEFVTPHSWPERVNSATLVSMTTHRWAGLCYCIFEGAQWQLTKISTLLPQARSTPGSSTAMSSCGYFKNISHCTMLLFNHLQICTFTEQITMH